MPLHSDLGNALKAQGKLEEAIDCYRRAIELNPKFASAHISLGIVLMEKGQLDESIVCFQRAIELDPEDGLSPQQPRRGPGDPGQNGRGDRLLAASL